MDTQTLAIVAVAINVAILLVVIAVAWYQRRPRGVPRRTEAAADVAGLAITSTYQGDSAVGGGALDAGSPWFPDRGATDARPAPDRSSAGPSGAAASTADPEALLDAATGFDVGPAWARWLAEEETRILRFHRPATVVLIELSGLDRLADRLGDVKRSLLVRSRQEQHELLAAVAAGEVAQRSRASRSVRFAVRRLSRYT